MFKPTDLIRLEPGVSATPLWKRPDINYDPDNHLGSLKTGEIGLVLQVRVIKDTDTLHTVWYRILKEGVTGWIRGGRVEKI
jgi:hypothetical protein